MLRLWKRRLGALAGVALAVFTVALGADTLHARPKYHTQFLAAYPSLADAAKEAKCNVCHFGTAKKNRNDYGEAMNKALAGKTNVKEEPDIDSVIKKIEGATGTQGKTFGELIKGGKLPGKEP